MTQDAARRAACTLAEVQLPDGESTSDIQAINANGYLVTINSQTSGDSMVSNVRTANMAAQTMATNTTSSTPNVGEEPNVQFKYQTWATGFDPQSFPHWLMVPQYASNSCLVYSGASASSTLSLAIRNGTGTVTPSSTSNNPETITVTGVSGSTSSVNYGIGSSPICSGTGLGITVKPYQNITIAMHVITGTSAATTPTSAPSASALQNYLNTVFGLQTNTYFTVTDSDATVNYDLNGNGKLDLGPNANTYSNEELAIKSACYSSSARFNIYFVHAVSCQYGDAAGVTSQPHNTAYIGDPTGIVNILNVTAHEVGHLFGITGHSNEKTITKNGSTIPNPTFVQPTTPSPAPGQPSPDLTDRLMYYQTAGGTLLVKPEWDFINPGNN